ncbi:chloride channel protein [Streptomyces inhibens]|uniref:chloride channel protein n=1 Tax=Streptomyces inhibens TaxID=2293571 RepID=UPI00402A9E4B
MNSTDVRGPRLERTGGMAADTAALGRVMRGRAFHGRRRGETHCMPTRLPGSPGVNDTSVDRYEDAKEASRSSVRPRRPMEAGMPSIGPVGSVRCTDHGLFAALGVVAGAVGVGFTRILYWIEDACDWAWHGPEWLRPAAGGLLLGLVLLVLPEMYGVGYPVLEKAAHGGYVAGFLLLLLAGKILATSLTIGIGGSGGVFAPSLFIGAMLGAAYGATTHQLMPGTAGAVGTYALVGMGAAFAGASRAPITAVVILFELTGQYSIILPLMLAIVLATLTSRLLSHDTVHTLKLRRRGIDLNAPTPGATLGTQTVESVMEGLPTPLPAATSLPDAADLLRLSDHGALPVVDAEGRYAGTLTARAVAEALTERPDGDIEPPAVAGDLAESAPPVTADMPLSTALHTLAAAPATGLRVLDPDKDCLLGWLTHQSALRALHTPATT